MNRTVYIFSVGDTHTTARHFARAIETTGEWDVEYLDHLPAPDSFADEDIFFYVDPAPAWPLEIEAYPCLTVAYLIDVHRDLETRLLMAQFFDAVFVAQKEYVSAFQAQGTSNSFWLPLACAADIHPDGRGDRPYEVGFVGQFGMRGTSRHEALSTVLPQFHTNDYRKFHSPQEMAIVYSQSKIVFNASICGDLNMRVFEAMASGALLVTDRIGNGLSGLFEEGRHYVAYSSVPEALDHIRYYLRNDSEREKIARDAQQLVIAEHSYEDRWRTIIMLAEPTKGQAIARSLAPSALAHLYAAIMATLCQPWRIVAVGRKYGSTVATIRCGLVACGRWLNARVPLTPNALKARLLSNR